MEARFSCPDQPIFRRLSEGNGNEENERKKSSDSNNESRLRLSSIIETEGDSDDEQSDDTENNNNTKIQVISPKVTSPSATSLRTAGKQLALEIPDITKVAAEQNGRQFVNFSSLDGSCCRTPPIVQAEMQEKGFKKWSRPNKVTERPVADTNQYSSRSNVWDMKGIRTEYGSTNIQMSSYRRRESNVAFDRKEPRRGSVMNVFFGELGGRRFSQDLRPQLNDFSGSGPEEPEDETAKVIFFQVFIPFLIAGFGNVGAGIILDNVQHWEVFQTITELFILVASFLGFKGNLEMTLAARLATQANTGKLDDPKNLWRIAVGNVALIQGQAIVVAFLAAVIAIAVNYFKDFDFNITSALLICATSLCTASITGLFLTALMVVITIAARRVGVNPDNVSTLFAAFLGDISAVALLSGSAKLFYDFRHVVWLAPVIIGVFFIVILPVSLWIAFHNEFTRPVVGTGWVPIIIAMIISSIGGFIFDYAVGIFETIAVFQPIINGVGANLVAVQASRISTYFHQRCEMGSLPAERGEKYQVCQSPFGAFFGKNANVRTARLLLLMSIPGHMIYVVTIRLVKSGEVVITLPFLALYLLVALLQVILLLYLAHLIVPYLWSKKIDPDNAAIPGIMATGDLLGTLFLTIAYFVLQTFHDPNTIRHGGAL
ncbi:Solute carrier family 41 member 1 [Halotydeus destructor]|nr:Solute carrier family 41 member 1 [Halotydeus destructor]